MYGVNSPSNPHSHKRLCYEKRRICCYRKQKATLEPQENEGMSVDEGIPPLISDEDILQSESPDPMKIEAAQRVPQKSKVARRRKEKEKEKRPEDVEGGYPMEVGSSLPQVSSLKDVKGALAYGVTTTDLRYLVNNPNFSRYKNKIRRICLINSERDPITGDTFSLLAQFPNLTTVALDLASIPIVDLSSLNNFPKLSTLRVWGCYDIFSCDPTGLMLQDMSTALMDISPLNILPKLSKLILMNSRILDLSVVNNFRKQIKLDLRDTSLSSQVLDNLGSLTRPQTIRFSSDEGNGEGKKEIAASLLMCPDEVLTNIVSDHGLTAKDLWGVRKSCGRLGRVARSQWLEQKLSEEITTSQLSKFIDTPDLAKHKDDVTSIRLVSTLARGRTKKPLTC